MLVIGLICILIPKTEWYKNDIKKHNYGELDDGIGYIRKPIGIIFILMGICMLVYNILLRIK